MQNCSDAGRSAGGGTVTPGVANRCSLLNAAAPFLSGALKIPSPVHHSTAQEPDMSHAASPFASAGPSRLTPLARVAMAIAVMIAMFLAGAALLGHSNSVAASNVQTSMPAAAVQLAFVTSTDLSVPQASAVFAGQEAAVEEACATF
jgi:hypothetical protein